MSVWHGRARVLRTVAAPLVVATLASCSIQVDGSPREVPAEREEALRPPAPDAVGAPADGDDRIYLRSPDEPDVLRTVPRTVDGTEELFAVLLTGPNDDERRLGVTSAIPDGVELNSVTIRGNVVTVDVSEEFTEAMTTSQTVIAVAQIVYTANLRQPGPTSVIITVDGNRRPWPDGASRQRRDALTVYDFYGLAESSQPSYPSPISPQPAPDR